MLSHTQQTLLRKLSARKHRWREGLFIAEGRKVVAELLVAGLKPKLLVAREASGWTREADVVLASEEFKKWSRLESADEVFGVFPFPGWEDEELGDLVVILDEIRDPGNLGTIVRTCDWFGVRQVFCTTGSTDIYNNKAVQGSMGSIARVQVHYADSAEILERLKESHQMFCADMKGTSLNEVQPDGPMAIVLGNETHGPSDFWKSHAEKITIPSFGKAESLNVAIANAVILGKLRLG